MNPSQQGKPIQDLSRIEILLADNKRVYMSAEPGDFYSVVWVCGKSFLRIWGDQPQCSQTPEQCRFRNTGCMSLLNLRERSILCMN